MEKILNGSRKQNTNFFLNSRSVNKKKYVIVKTGKEIKPGDTVTIIQEADTSFGHAKVTNTFFSLDSDTLERLIKEGFIREVEEVKKDNNISFYIAMMADNMKCSQSEVLKWLNKMNSICPKAVLDILLTSIAVHLCNKDPKAFEASECFYSLRPKDGKVGKIVNFNAFIPCFKSKEDAEFARTILAEQLNYMYGE